MGIITELDFARVRHKPTGKEGLVIPELFGWRFVSWDRVQVMFDNDHGHIVRIILVKELEVIEILDPATVDKSRFSLMPSKNGSRKKKVK